MINRRRLLTALTVSATLLLSGCEKMVVWNPKGPVAQDEKDLLITAVSLMLIIVVPVLIATLVIARRYRASNKKAKYDPDFTHSTKLELLWWTLPIIIVSILATVTWISTHRLDPYRPLSVPGKPITIQVVALEWRWLFIYPEQNIATMNFVEFPANTPINFVITSDAPMNSFQIQQLAGQIYAMAGMQTKLHLLASEPGDYHGRSVSFSGEGFSNMTFVARAVSPDQFNTWVQSVQKMQKPLTMSAYNQLVPPMQDTTVLYFSPVVPNLFNDIIMKYMMPPPVNPQMDFNDSRDYQHHKDMIMPPNTLIKG